MEQEKDIKKTIVRYISDNPFSRPRNLFEFLRQEGFLIDDIQRAMDELRDSREVVAQNGFLVVTQ